MRLISVFIFLLLTASASAQYYRVGEHYEPYGECVEVKTETRTLYSRPTLYSPPMTALTDSADPYVVYPEPVHSLSWYAPEWRYHYDRPRWNRWRWRRWYRHHHHHHHYHDCRCD